MFATYKRRMEWGKSIYIALVLDKKGGKKVLYTCAWFDTKSDAMNAAMEWMMAKAEPKEVK